MKFAMLRIPRMQKVMILQESVAISNRKIFVPNEVNMVYSMYDRMVVGGALPVGEVLTLEAIDPLKAPFFLTRREMGIYNVGGPGVVKAGDAVFELDYKKPSTLVRRPCGDVRKQGRFQSCQILFQLTDRTPQLSRP